MKTELHEELLKMAKNYLRELPLHRLSKERRCFRKENIE